MMRLVHTDPITEEVKRADMAGWSVEEVREYVQVMLDRYAMRVSLDEVLEKTRLQSN